MKCCFCDYEETTEYLFLVLSQKLFGALSYVLTIFLLPNTKQMFGNCLKGIEKMTKARI
jgi:hypothetical protein